MRPTPSPTGSTGSRSMSPAVGQQNIPMPPRPSSSQSDGSGPTRMSHSPMAAQGGYQPHLCPPAHMGYKMSMPPGQQLGMYGQGHGGGGSGGSYGAPGSYGPATGPGPGPSPGSIRPQYGATPSQAYGAPSPGSQQQSQQQQQQGPVTNNATGSPGTGQYPGRQLVNHVPHTQYPGAGYQPAWNSGSAPPSQQGKVPGGSVPTPAVSQPPVGASRPPHYLKQHLQHKIGASAGFGSSGATGPSSLQVYGAGAPPPGMPMGPPPHGPHHIHQGMGPPTSMGPPNMVPPPSLPAASSIGSGPPPASQAGQTGPPLGIQQQLPNNHEPGAPPMMPPPSSTPNSHSMHSLQHGCEPQSSDMLDSGITTTAGGSMMTHVTSAAGGTVTSVVTTGPDGTTLDEGSQQSTLSNTSAASGEDHQCTTPKSRKNDLTGGGHYGSHPATPQSTVPSPAASLNSMHEEYDMSSPSWPRTPASPVSTPIMDFVFSAHTIIVLTSTYLFLKTSTK